MHGFAEVAFGKEFLLFQGCIFPFRKGPGGDGQIYAVLKQEVDGIYFAFVDGDDGGLVIVVFKYGDFLVQDRSETLVCRDRYDARTGRVGRPLHFILTFARDKSSLSGWGATKIRYALAAKGIDSETISSALAEIDADKASDRLAKLLAVKYKSLISSAGRSSFPALDDASAAYQLRQKLARFALGRGYSYDDISSAIDVLMKGR